MCVNNLPIIELGKQTNREKIMKTGHPIEAVKSDETTTLNLITFRLSNGDFGFCIKNKNEAGYPLTVLFCNQIEAIKYHQGVLNNLLNNDLPKSIKDFPESVDD